MIALRDVDRVPERHSTQNVNDIRCLNAKLSKSRRTKRSRAGNFAAATARSPR